MCPTCKSSSCGLMFSLPFWQLDPSQLPHGCALRLVQADNHRGQGRRIFCEGVHRGLYGACAEESKRVHPEGHVGFISTNNTHA